MEFIIKNKNGLLKNYSKKVVKCKTYDEARRIMINYCDLSDEKLQIIENHNNWMLIE